jgi:hypothetical protein
MVRSRYPAPLSWRPSAAKPRFRRAVGRAGLAAVAALLTIPATPFAQTPPPAAATSYQQIYDDVTSLVPARDQVADVSHLVLSRDAGRLILEHGKLYPLAPLGGRLVGAVFRGEGRFTFAPWDSAEAAQLRRFAGSAPLDEAISEAILVFADSTGQELRGLSFAAGDVPGAVRDHVRDLIGSLKGEKSGSFDRGVMGPLLNGETSGFFLARLTRALGDPLLFVLDPTLSEGVRLYRPVSHSRWGTNWAVVAQLPQLASPAGPSGLWPARARLQVPSYRMDVHLAEAFTGGVGMAASATLAVRALEPIGPWLLFDLHPKLTADSARWAGGEAAALFKADESPDLWVRAPHRLRAGDSLALTVFYHGDVIDRYGDFFYVDPLAAWYPINGQGERYATFDLTFHSPARYAIASIGERTDSSVADRVLTTRWVMRRPTSYASFNLGLFEDRVVQEEGAPPLHVLLSDEAHALLRRQLAAQGYMLLEQRHMRENVASDVANSLKLFTWLFGECPYDRFTITEIPYAEGVSFPALIDLSWGTFQNTTLDGFDEFFRAHETAHQWWGNGVLAGSYRDAWLSEGLASFSGLWYLQAKRKRNTEYFKFLDQYQADIENDRAEVGPIWLGYRNSTPDVPRGYDVVVYEKGAWVFNMLRVLMLDLGTMRDDRFLDMMRDYYRTFRDHPATVDDFQRIVERHIGQPMGWFFDEWVKGTGLPTYHVAWTSQSAGGGKYTVRFRIAEEHVPPDFRMPVLVAVDLGDHRTARFRVDVHGARGEYTSPLLPAEPRSVVFNDLHAVLAHVKMERW